MQRKNTWGEEGVSTTTGMGDRNRTKIGLTKEIDKGN
jgi:hypothetical protein